MTRFSPDLHGAKTMTSGWTALLLIMVLINPSCHHENDRQRLIVTGTVVNLAGMIYLLEQDTAELRKLDSISLTGDSTFEFTVFPDETSIYAIRFKSTRQLVFIAAPGDTIRIRGDFLDFPGTFMMEGNPETALLQSFYRFTFQNTRKVDSLQQIIELSQGTADFYSLSVRTDSLFALIWEMQRDYEKALLRENAGALASLLIVNFHFGVKPVLSPETDRSDYARVDSSLRVAYPGNRHVAFFHRWLREE